MEVIDVDSPPPPLCQNEKPQELFSVDWRSASDMFWQLENRKSSLLEYLSEYGPRDFPTLKKRLKKLKRTLTKLESAEPSHHDHPNGSEKAKLGKFRALFDEVAGHVNVATVRLNQPGLRKFFVEGIGKDVLPSLERRHSCSVEPVCESPSPVALMEGLESRFSSDLLEESLFTPSEVCTRTVFRTFYISFMCVIAHSYGAGFQIFFQFVVFIFLSFKIKRTWDTVDYPSTQLLHRTLLLMTIFGSVLGSTLDSPTPRPDNVVIPNVLISSHFAPYSILFGLRGKSPQFH